MLRGESQLATRGALMLLYDFKSRYHVSGFFVYVYVTDIQKQLSY